MSVLVLNTDVIQEIANTLCVMASSNNRVIDKEHPCCVNWLFSRNDINPNKPLAICTFVALLWQFNQDTWEAKHGNKELDFNEEDIQHAAEALVEHHEAHWAHPAKVVQLYKWIGCLSYNIDLEGWGAHYIEEHKQDMYTCYLKLLNDLENNLARHIVTQLDEYNEAKYCEV